MNRPKWVAVLSGVLALIVSIGYLLLVQLLDFRGEFKPAPIGIVTSGSVLLPTLQFQPDRSPSGLSLLSVEWLKIPIDNPISIR